MELATVTPDVGAGEAKERSREYLEAFQATNDEEYRAIARGYRWMARGKQIIDLRETIQRGGVDQYGLPRLAVMRADVQWCWMISRRSNGAVTLSCDQNPHWKRRSGVFRFPSGTLPHTTDTQGEVFGWRPQYRAMVPVIPPHLQPKFALWNYDILWEVDRWEKMPPPPGDPALLKRLYGWLYVVLAVWDLTPLEQAVLGARTD